MLTPIQYREKWLSSTCQNTYNRKIIKVGWVDSLCSKEGLDRSIGHEW
ncbi:hypothetical protein GBAR_LOCUS16876 [Geodia barretti]|uniref:Uncharacterized protein n=1 Tax=Geodia barretti TaxID=519541 RepID=A0AA35WX20_GEOBA|nr:hypothetical protein GBAR_LOCUS16876 [Geodia barretti]